MATSPLQLIYQVKAPLLTKQLVDQAYKATAKAIKLPKGFQVNIVTVSPKTMQSLNHEYRKLNEVTDILSFTYSDTEGELVVCYDQAVKQANHKVHSVHYELSWLIIHGLLHLQGYDHETASDAQIMRPLERDILCSIYGN